ncbi:MAG: hypothetical protein LBF59_05925, partial [Prevotellaceae bacterium]|nr:hypothetical protein [Prevotellaceae bacterium]
GFAGTENALSERDLVANETVLSGDIGTENNSADNVYHVAVSAGSMIKGTDTARLDGFTITKGYATGGESISVNGESGISRGNGGGVYLSSTDSPVLNNLVIVDNLASNNGGGAYIYNSSPVLSNAHVVGNTSNGGGGIFNEEGGSPVLTNVLVAGNASSADGGGIHNSNSSLTLTNVQISGNAVSVANGGGIYNNGSCVMTNVTIASNMSYGTGGGVYYRDGITDVRNSIIWGNAANNGNANVDKYLSGSGAITFSYSLLEGQNPPGAGNLDGALPSNDPQFASPIPASATPASGGDYSLQVASPVVNMGDNTLYNAGKTPDLNHLTTDLAGNPRFFGSAVDLGAYEVQRVPVTAVRDTATTRVSTSVVIDILSNDDYLLCSPVDVFGLISDSGPKNGAVSVNLIDSTLVYTPNSGHYGVDSLDYEIGCGGGSSSARVYIMTLKPLSEEYRACPDVMITMGFEKKENVYYDWFNEAGNPIKSSSDTIKRIKDNSGATQQYLARPFWQGIEFPPDTVKLHPATDATPQVSDIRVMLCPEPGRIVSLAKFLDVQPYATGALQWSSTGMSPAISASTGNINTSNFPNRGTFAYSYTHFSECSTSSAVGKAYVYIPHGKIPPRPDTVAFCLDQAGAINVNKIFGLELAGSWILSDNVVADNTATNSLGAIIFNGQKAYQETKNNTAYDAIYRGVSGKKFVFEYDYSASSCASGRKKIVVIVHE